MNDRIRAQEVRLVGADGDQLGIKPLPEALAIARSEGLDLVEVAAQARPPVCRIMDWGKHLYEQSQRQKESKKKQSQVVVKEMKFRPKIDHHDFETKKRHVIRFLEDGAKVKVTIMFRGREMTHTELGKKILDELAEDVEDLAVVESPPKLDGRNMLMVLAPTKKEKEEQESERRPRGKRRGKGKRRQQAQDAAEAAHKPDSVADAESAAEDASDDDAEPDEDVEVDTETQQA